MCKREKFNKKNFLFSLIVFKVMSFSKDFWVILKYIIYIRIISYNLILIQGSFKIVLDRYEEGRNSLNILINFIKDKITIEEKYYAKMSKLCSKPTGWTEKWFVFLYI